MDVHRPYPLFTCCVTCSIAALSNQYTSVIKHPAQYCTTAQTDPLPAQRRQRFQAPRSGSKQPAGGTNTKGASQGGERERERVRMRVRARVSEKETERERECENQEITRANNFTQFAD